MNTFASKLEEKDLKGEFSNRELTFSTGMALINFNESTGDLVGPNAKAPESGSVSVVAGLIDYKFKSSGKYHYSVGATFPMMGSSQGSYFDGHFSVEYHFGQMNSEQGIEDYLVEVKLKPKFRYYIGTEVGIAYITYSTISTKKNDTTFNLGILGGITYDVTKNWAMRFQTTALRTTGVITSGIAIKGTLGAIFFLGK